jgi:hypothetical protein
MRIKMTAAYAEDLANAMALPVGMEMMKKCNYLERL